MRASSVSALGLLLLMALPASADDLFVSHRIRCDWQREAAGIQADIDGANALGDYRCDATLHAAVQGRFLQLDQQSLALYNRGVVLSVYTPNRAASPPPIVVGTRRGGRGHGTGVR